MAGGPYLFSAATPITPNRTFPSQHVGPGTFSRQRTGLGVAASILGTATWRLDFPMPHGMLPAGTPKFLLGALASATTGVAKVDLKWASFAPGEDPSAKALASEGTAPDVKIGPVGAADTLEWITASLDVLVVAKWTLNANTADPVTASETLAVDLDFLSTGWTLAVVSTWFPSIVFE